MSAWVGNIVFVDVDLICAEVANLAKGPKVWWYIAYQVLEAAQQDDSFRVREIKVFYCYRGRVEVEADVKR